MLAATGVFAASCLLRVRSATASPSAAISPATRPVQPSTGFAVRSASEQQILNHVPAELTVFRFAGNRRILVLDFPTLYQQGMMLNRVAALIEKARSPRTQVLTDVELVQTIRSGGDTVETYYYGHDYSAASLRRFFTLADQQHVALDPDEEALRNLLRQEGWFEHAVQAGLISVPAVGANADISPSVRRTILHHELSHGEFFSNADYGSFVRHFWEFALSFGERAAVRRFLGSEGYDTSYEELMYNEMQAYLMFTRDPEFFAPECIGMTSQRLADLQSKFLRGKPAGWLHDALAATPVYIHPPRSLPPAVRGVHHARAA